jgi:hypothetical protein
MKNSIKISLLSYIMFSVIISCGKIDDKSQIVFHSIGKEYVLIKDVKTLQNSNDEISNYVDSILSGLINSEFVTTGQKNFDLDADDVSDIGFDIIDLNKINENELPVSFDTLAARVFPMKVELLDKTTYGYPDALDFGVEISKNGFWSNKNPSVLGTFLNAGKFQGKGEKYLGIRFLKDDNFKYGWIKIYCSQHNDTLRIIEYGYNDVLNSKIKAGQKE